MRKAKRIPGGRGRNFKRGVAKEAAQALLQGTFRSVDEVARALIGKHYGSENYKVGVSKNDPLPDVFKEFKRYIVDELRDIPFADHSENSWRALVGFEQKRLSQHYPRIAQQVDRSLELGEILKGVFDDIDTDEGDDANYSTFFDHPEASSPDASNPDEKETEMDDVILRRPEVERITGLSRATIYQEMAEGAFPIPVRIGKRAVGWQKRKIVDWLAKRPLATPPKSLPSASRRMLTGDPRFDEITKHQFPEMDWNGEDTEE
jgi:prophage regulatory protein